MNTQRMIHIVEQKRTTVETAAEASNLASLQITLLKDLVLELQKKIVLNNLRNRYKRIA